MNGTAAFPVRLDNPRVWRAYLGGALLDRLHGQAAGKDDHFPEEWIMSVTSANNPNRSDPAEGLSRAAETDRTLCDLLESDPQRYLGKSKADPGVLVKLIDSSERLGVQVHPDKAAAQRLFQSDYGKTECWHMLGTRRINGEEPCVYLGFQPGVTREKWKDLFDRQDIQGMLNAMHRYSVHPGDTLLVEGGTPHAIGAGCFLIEIQEPTDYTIRTERVTPSGFHVADSMCHQGIGFDKMFDVFHYQGLARSENRGRCFVPATTSLETEAGRIVSLIGYDRTPCFALEEIQVTGKMEVPAIPSFYGLYILAGSGVMRMNRCQAALEKTAQFFVPAGAPALEIEAEKDKPLRIMRFLGPKAALTLHPISKRDTMPVK